MRMRMHMHMYMHMHMHYGYFLGSSCCAPWAQARPPPTASWWSPSRRGHSKYGHSKYGHSKYGHSKLGLMVVSEQAGREAATVGGMDCTCTCTCSKPRVWCQAEQEYRDTEQLVQTLSEYKAILRQVAGARPP